MYQFTDKTALDRAIEGPDMKRLVADFNRDWPDVTRTREVLATVYQYLGIDARGAMLPDPIGNRPRPLLDEYNPIRELA